MNNIIEIFSRTYLDSYAGCFYDGNNTLHINLVNGTEVRNIMEFNNMKFEYVFVEFSLKQLQETLEKVKGIMEELEISTVELNEKDNKVIIYTKSDKDYLMKKLKVLVNVKTIILKDKEMNIQF